MKQYLRRTLRISQKVTVSTLLVSGLAFGSSHLPAFSAPAIPEIEVSSAPFARSSDIAVDTNGNFVVVWLTESGRDEYNNPLFHIYGRRYNNAGEAQGESFQISTTRLTGTQNAPQVAMDGAGNFVVAWSGVRSQYDYTTLLHTRRYDANGTPLTDEMSHEAISPLYDRLNLSMDDAGDYVVVWARPDENYDIDVYGQRFDAEGTPQGVAFRVNSYTANTQMNPDVAVNAAGDFVVVWQSNGQDGSENGIYGQRFAASGAPIDGEFRANSTTANDQATPTVALNDAGSFVVSWTGRNVENTEQKVYGQKFLSTGEPVGAEVATGSYYNQGPVAAIASNGDFLLIWEAAGDSSNNMGIFGQRYSNTGSSLGIPFQVNAKSQFEQTEPSVAMQDDGAFVASWHTWGWSGSNYIDETVSARRYGVGDPSAAGPDAVDDTVEVLPNGPAQELPILDNDNLQYNYGTTISEFTLPQHGTLEGAYPWGWTTNTYGQFSALRYTPNPGFVGTDTFTYTLRDTRGETDTATVTIHVTGPNTPPNAYSGYYGAYEDQAFDLRLFADDPDGNELTYEVLSQPTLGTLSGDAPNLIYTPNPDANGTDTIDFKVTDSAGASSSATATIFVGPVNDVPVAKDQTVDAEAGVAKQITLEATDVEGDALTYSIWDAPAHGTLTGSGTQWTYTPEANFTGQDTFTFRAQDNETYGNFGTVTINVVSSNHAPVAESQSVTVAEDNSKSIALGASDSDGDTLTFSIVSGPAHGTLSGDGANRTYTPHANFNGSDSFSFKVSDGQTESEVATVEISVTPVNDAPVAVNDKATTRKKTTVTVPVLANDTDIDGGTLSIASVTQGANGSVVINGTTVKYTPRNGFKGIDSFSYTISDGKGGTATATVTVTVNN